MKKLIRLLKQAYCEHLFGNGEPNPFVDQYGQHSAIFTCEKCGYKQFRTFGKKY
jgi:hypothetical protein